ncbi:MAG: Dna2/Cas4 domain-containing protein [Nitrosarchaeum sp.]|nr:Dna2/Cas4 domain-containing protein [Nitrosarchaeum sp.]MCV0399487.1 Dna2/Cas4 domain-containing protein [Nitrosarchaeum sp.]
MMGDRDFRSLIKNAVESIGRELEIEIDSKDIKTIHLKEVVQCLRRSYYDRVDPKEEERRGFSDLLSGLLRKLQFGSNPKEYVIDDIKLKGQADMIADDSIILFRPTNSTPQDPKANDLLYLNACMWIYEKKDGMIIYISGNREESSFALIRDKKMFEEVVRRVRVLNDLLKEQKTPILEPSTECTNCQYYQRCYITKKNTKQTSLAEMLGFSKDD